MRKMPEEKKSEKQIKIENIETVREEEKSLIDSWKSNKTWKDIIDTPAYFEMINYIKMVASGESKCVVIEGAGGFGKSFNTLAILNKENPNYSYTDSYSTAPAFYIWLYKNRDKIVVCDDVIGIMEDRRAQAYLKSATWEVNGKRIIHNMSTKPLEDEDGKVIPSHFEFKGAVIILTNKINKKNPHIKAILTRANYTEVEIGFEEKMKIIEHINKKPYGNLSTKEREEILDFIKEHASEAIPDLNLRTLIHFYKFYEYSKKIGTKGLWKRLGMKLMKKDDLLVLVMELEKDEKLATLDKKVAKFKEVSDKSRATYFRLKSRLNQKSQVSQDV